ncbi:hypothetical protein ACIRCZ_09360 [Leifsonia sp. NPDC102414]|uniref:hypothetical protein n=1 Tax=Leifsonia sp. NPDC102414 TaxID=3364124 RepID=UPI0037F5B6DC
MAKKKNKKLTVAEANRAYFIVLANSRASLTMFSGLPFVIIPVLVTLNISFLNPPPHYRGYEVLLHLAGVNVVIVWVCVAFTILWMFKSLTYRFQVFSSGVMAVLAVCMVYSLCLMCLGLATLVQARGEPFFAMLFSVAGLVAVALVVGSTVVHVLMLRHRLRVGHSENRTMGNIGAVSMSNRSKTFWIIAGVVAVVPNVLTQGQYLTNSLGAVGLLVIAFVTPSLPVEYAYLTYLKSKDRDYWEERPRRATKKERRRVAKKVALWVFGVIATFGLVWVSGKVLPLWL